MESGHKNFSGLFSIPRYMEALIDVGNLHKDHERFGGDCYLIHPIRVSTKTFSTLMSDSFFRVEREQDNFPEVAVDYAIAALYHDAVEDNEDFELDDLYKRVGGNQVIVDAVDILTKESDIESTISKLRQGNKFVQTIKGIDIEDNTSDHSVFIVDWNEERSFKFIQKKFRVLKSLYKCSNAIKRNGFENIWSLSYALDHVTSGDSLRELYSVYYVK